MQTTYLAQPFYNFLNQFSYNFERSDPKKTTVGLSASKLQKNWIRKL